MQHAISRQDRLEPGGVPLTEAQARIVDASPADRPTPPSPELIAADLDFHREMVRLTGSPRLSRARGAGRRGADPARLAAGYPGSGRLRGITLVLLALESRDPHAASVARRHLRLGLDLIAGEARNCARRVTILTISAN